MRLMSLVADIVPAVLIWICLLGIHWSHPPVATRTQSARGEWPMRCFQNSVAGSRFRAASLRQLVVATLEVSLLLSTERKFVGAVLANYSDILETTNYRSSLFTSPSLPGHIRS